MSWKDWWTAIKQRVLSCVVKPVTKQSPWPARWFAMVRLVASWSKDQSRKTGCVIVDERQVLLAIGWNGFPRGVKDDVFERHYRPVRYLWTHHAEANAVCNAAAAGIPLRGATMYLTWYPCAPCARTIVQAGIAKLVCGTFDSDDPTYKEDFPITKQILEEGNVKVEYLCTDNPPQRNEHI